MATVTTDVTALYELKFTQMFELLAQQQDARIPQHFRQGDHRGSKGAQAVKQIGALDPDERTVRLEPITYSDVIHDARWVYPTFFDKAIAFDTWDELQTAADPRSTYAQTLMAGMNRKKDKVCLTAMFADAKTGETGSDTTVFDATNQEVAVNFEASGNTRLTIAKLIEGQRILLQNEVDLEMDEMFCTMRAKDRASLMHEVTVTSKDFNSAAVIETGKLVGILGINLVHTEQLATSGANSWNAMWVTSGMHYGTWQDVQTKIYQDTTRRGHPWVVYVTAFFGATRLQEKKVVRMLSITA